MESHTMDLTPMISPKNLRPKWELEMNHSKPTYEEEDSNLVRAEEFKKYSQATDPHDSSEEDQENTESSLGLFRATLTPAYSLRPYKLPPEFNKDKEMLKLAELTRQTIAMIVQLDFKTKDSELQYNSKKFGPRYSTEAKG